MTFRASDSTTDLLYRLSNLLTDLMNSGVYKFVYYYYYYYVLGLGYDVKFNRCCSGHDG